jgi:hypothetical protein
MLTEKILNNETKDNAFLIESFQKNNNKKSKYYIISYSYFSTFFFYGYY